tara:strand:- start:1559 stop:1768 length:210 start_codon:yes stop_codon:yes gene_type:complete
MIGYCVKCRNKTEMLNPKRKTLKKGRQAMQGTCPKCGTKMTVFVAKENKSKKEKPKKSKSNKKNKSEKK